MILVYKIGAILTNLKILMICGMLGKLHSIVLSINMPPLCTKRVKASKSPWITSPKGRSAQKRYSKNLRIGKLLKLPKLI